MDAQHRLAPFFDRTAADGNLDLLVFTQAVRSTGHGFEPRTPQVFYVSQLPILVDFWNKMI